MRKTNKMWNRLSKFALVLCFMAGLSYTAKAQIAQGTSFVGGIANFQAGKTEPGINLGVGLLTDFQIVSQFAPFVAAADSAAGDFNNISFQIVPQVGYFFSDRFAAGLGAGFRYAWNEAEGTETKIKAWLIPIAPFIRYYTPLGDAGRGGLFYEIVADFEFGDSEVEVGGVEQADASLFVFQPQLNIAFYYFVTPNFGIEGIWGVVNYSLIDSADESAYQFGLGADLTDITLGARWYFYR